MDIEELLKRSTEYESSDYQRLLGPILVRDLAALVRLTLEHEEADRPPTALEEAETLLAEAASIVDAVMAYADCHTSPALLNAAERFSKKLCARKEGKQ